MAKKKKQSLLASNFAFVRQASRGTQTFLFVAVFGVIGGGGWLVFGASAANNVTASGTCVSQNSQQYYGVGRVDISAQFDETGGKGAKVDYVDVATDANINLTDFIRYKNGVTGYAYQSVQVKYKRRLFPNGRPMTNTAGKPIYRADVKIPINTVTDIEVPIQPASRGNVKNGCRVQLSPYHSYFAHDTY